MLRRRRAFIQSEEVRNPCMAPDEESTHHVIAAYGWGAPAVVMASGDAMPATP